MAFGTSSQTTGLPFQKPFVAAMIIPTGVGASIGGFGGDATPQLNLLASVTDVLITHPNVANAAMFQKLPTNALYVEGYGLDQFLRGRRVLRPVRKNRIGVVFDAGIEPEVLTLHLNTMNAVRAVYGLDILPHVLTSEPLRTHCGFDPSGTSTGRLENPAPLLDACESLLSAGADALALCVRMPDLEGEEAYGNGSGVDPVGGIEAILSHLVVSTFNVPCAHAPAFSLEKSQPEWHAIVDPRAASEYITPTFLPCILTGLSKAPRLIDAALSKPTDLAIQDLDALVAPANALGGIPVLACLERNIPIIPVMENQTVLPMDPTAWSHLPNASFTPARSYPEAAGLLQALRLGLEIRPPVEVVEE